MINNFDTNFLLKHPEKKNILNANCLALQTFSKFSVETHITFVFFSNSSISKNLKKKSRSNRPEVFCQKGLLKNFAQFIRKHKFQAFGKVSS